MGDYEIWSRERGLPVGAIDIIPIIETGKGMINIRSITVAATRVKRIAFGAGDFTLDMNIGMEPG